MLNCDHLSWARLPIQWILYSSLMNHNINLKGQTFNSAWNQCPSFTGSVVAERSSALDSSSGVARMWVRIPAWPVVALVSLSKTLNHNCFVLRMGRKAVGPMCCVMHVKEPKRRGLAPVFLDSRLEHPAGWICARYKSYHYYYYYYFKMNTVTKNYIYIMQHVGYYFQSLN